MKKQGSKASVLILQGRMGGDFPSGSVVKKLPANAGDTRDMDLTPGLGRSPGGGHGNPLQYSSLENFTDRGAWGATVHTVTESQIQLSTHACTHKTSRRCMSLWSLKLKMLWRSV